MIRHIVALRFPTGHDPCPHMAELAALLPLVPGALAFHPFTNISPEDPVVHGFRHGFWFDFADAAARDAYLIHPAHQAAGAGLVAACGLDGILVIDLDL
jgi:hypothetical protein